MLYFFWQLCLQYNNHLQDPKSKGSPVMINHRHKVNGVGCLGEILQTAGGPGNKAEGLKQIRGGLWEKATQSIRFYLSYIVHLRCSPDVGERQRREARETCAQQSIIRAMQPPCSRFLHLEQGVLGRNFQFKCFHKPSNKMCFLVAPRFPFFHTVVTIFFQEPVSFKYFYAEQIQTTVSGLSPSEARMLLNEKAVGKDFHLGEIGSSSLSPNPRAV